MRLSLDRRRLLGFETRTDLDLPATAAMVGSKTTGISVPTASHRGITDSTPVHVALTFPTK